MVIPVSGIHRGTLPAMRFARSLSKDVTAVMVDVEPEVTAVVREKWVTWGYDIPLLVLESPYRSTIGPLLDYLADLDHREPATGHPRSDRWLVPGSRSGTGDRAGSNRAHR